MDRIRRAQLDYVFQQLKITGLPHALAVTVTAGVIYFNSGSPSIFLWFAVIQASHILRIKFLDPMWGSALQQNDFLLIERMLVLGMFMIGCTWSVIPLFYMSDMGSEIFIFCSMDLSFPMVFCPFAFRNSMGISSLTQRRSSAPLKLEEPSPRSWLNS